MKVRDREQAQSMTLDILKRFKDKSELEKTEITPKNNWKNSSLMRTIYFKEQWWDRIVTNAKTAPFLGKYSAERGISFQKLCSRASAGLQGRPYQLC